LLKSEYKDRLNTIVFINTTTLFEDKHKACDGPSHACSSYCIRLALKPPKDSRNCPGQLANAKAVS
jgi:hypothetical protein